MKTAFAWLSVLLLSPLCTAADLPAIVPTQFTNHDLHRAVLAYNDRTLGQAYLQVGQRHPNWDSAAKAFLDRLGERFTDANFGWCYVSDADTTPKTLTAISDVAVKAGCSDPLVLYGRAILLRDEGDQVAYQRLLKECLQPLIKSKYPAVRKYAAVSHYLELKPALDPQKLAELQQQLSTLRADFAGEKEVDPIERRIKLQILEPEFDALDTESASQFINNLAAGRPDPWLLHLLRGKNEINLAWKDRGSGYANTVTDDGWKGFRKHLDLARDELIAAYTAEPDYPEAATQLIVVAMAGADTGDTTRGWFERAIDAQIDWQTPWNNYLYSLYPRWGGSHAQMYALGCEAMRTRRFDTQTPLFLLQALKEIAHDLQVDYSVYGKPGVWTNIKTVCDGYLDQKYSQPVKDWLQTREAAFAYRAGEYETVNQLLDGLKGNATGESFDEVGTTYFEAYAESRAATSSIGDQVRAAISAEHGNDYVTAENIYLRAVKRIQPEHPAWAFLQLHQRTADVRAAMIENRKADILTKDANDAIVWGTDANGWSITDGALTFSSGERKVDAIARHVVTLPANARISIEWSYTDAKQTDRFEVLMVLLDFDGDGGSLAVVAAPYSHSLHVGTNAWTLKDSSVFQLDYKPNVWHTCVIEHVGKTVSVEQDGQQLLKNITNDWLGVGTPVLGFGRIDKQNGSDRPLSEHIC